MYAIRSYYAGGAAFAAVDGGFFTRQQQVEQAIFGMIFGLDPYRMGFFLFDHDNGQFEQIPHHALDVAADVTDFGEFAGFDFDERRLGQFGQTPGDFGFTDSYNFV